MVELTRIVKQLLTSAVNDSETPAVCVIDENQWKRVLGICAAQNVHTLVYDYLPVGMPDEVRSIWQEQVDAVVDNNGLASAVRESQEEAWRKNGLKYALMKGESVASLYAHPEHRGAGDIDWFFADRESWDKAMHLAEKNAESGTHRDSDGDVNYLFKGVVIEHHADWTHLSSRKLRREAGTPVIVDGRFSPEDTIFLLICHILHHMAFVGLGLKQFADLASAYIKFDGKYDKASLVGRMSHLKLAKWASLLSAALVELTGISEEVLPFAPSRNKKDTDMLIRLVMEDGYSPKARNVGAGFFFDKMMLMFKYCPREATARHYHLIKGRVLRKMFV